jgi:Na+-translocating ferredoxin:NAD+ oxidoreductase RNF subunit RnfB
VTICIERCHFSAIEMQKVPGSRKFKTDYVNEKCMGCDLCIVKCPTNSLTLELVRPPEQIPAEPAEGLENKREGFPDWLGAGA